MMRITLGRAAVVVGLVLGAGACGGGGGASGTEAATATTFTADRGVISAFDSMVTAAGGASLFAASGAGTSQAADCASLWAGIRDRVVQRDTTIASTIDAAIAQLQAATRNRDAVGAAGATATLTQAAADYTRQFP